MVSFQIECHTNGSSDTSFWYGLAILLMAMFFCSFAKKNQVIEWLSVRNSVN